MASATRKKQPIITTVSMEEEEVKTYRARVVVELNFEVQATNIDDANDMALDDWIYNIGFSHPISVEVYEEE